MDSKRSEGQGSGLKMDKNILVVDDNQEMLFALQDGLEQYQDLFSVTISGNGLSAIEKLKREPFSLVVTDLKMPHMDGLSLSGHIHNYFPETPVILISGYLTPDLKQAAHKSGIVAQLEKPFMVEDLADMIRGILRSQSNGGTLQKVSTSMFLQLIEMEQKSCTIRLKDLRSLEKGVLFFKGGQLMDSRVRHYRGEAAAHRIFGWDLVYLEIETGCPVNNRKIHKDVQAVYLEALHMKDELADEKKPPPVVGTIHASQPNPEINLETIRKKLMKGLGNRNDLKDLYHDDRWKSLVVQMNRIGDLLGTGPLKLACMEPSESDVYLLLPGAKTAVVVLNRRCPKDRIIKALLD